MKKQELLNFINRYHLAGATTSVKWVSKDGTLETKFITDDQNVIGTIESNNLDLGNSKMSLNYTYNLNEKQTGITNLLQDIKDTGLKLRDLKTEQNTLEKIFVSLVKENNEI